MGTAISQAKPSATPTILGCVSDVDWTTGHCHPKGCVPSTLLHRQRSKAREAVGLTQSWCEMMEPGCKARLPAPAPPATLPSGRDSGPAIEQTCHLIFLGPQFALLQMNVCSVVSDSFQPQAPLSMGFPRQEYWSGLPVSSPRGLPDSGIEPTSLDIPALAGRFITTSTAWEGRLKNPPPDLFNLNKPLDCASKMSQGHAHGAGGPGRESRGGRGSFLATPGWVRRQDTDWRSHSLWPGEQLSVQVLTFQPLQQL